MYDALFRDETELATREAIRNPLAPRPLTPRWWNGVGSALADFVPAAGAEMGRAILTVGEFAGRGLGVQQGLIAPQDMLKSEFQEEHGKIGETIRRFSPDPATSGIAAQIVHGAGKVLGKAAVYGATGGLPGAIVGLGLDEGINETLRLTDQGVDLGTAAKVGAVHGVATGATVALPAAGTTLAKTAGLIAAGGPAAFMAEQQVARMILQSADYGSIAERYDPLDPVGLAVSTILAGAVGAASHAARGKGADTSLLAKPPDPELVAAAHTVASSEHLDATSLVPRGDIAGMNAHADGLEAVARQMQAGERVAVPSGVMADADIAGKAAGRISQAAARAADDIDPALRERAVAERPGESVEPAPARAGDEPSTVAAKPEAADEQAIAAAARAIEENPDTPVPTGALDENGKAQVMSAREFARMVEEEYARDVADSKAFDAAVDCFLQAA